MSWGIGGYGQLVALGGSAGLDYEEAISFTFYSQAAIGLTSTAGVSVTLDPRDFSLSDFSLGSGPIDLVWRA